MKRKILTGAGSKTETMSAILRTGLETETWCMRLELNWFRPKKKTWNESESIYCLACISHKPKLAGIKSSFISPSYIESHKRLLIILSLTKSLLQKMLFSLLLSLLTRPSKLYWNHFIYLIYSDEENVSPMAMQWSTSRPSSRFLSRI